MLQSDWRKSGFVNATLSLVVFFVVPIIIINNLIGETAFWKDIQLGPAGLYEEFCEKNRMDAFLREKMNSWSNLAFVWCGLVCLFMGFADKKSTDSENLIIKMPIISYATGLSLIYLGLGSFLYHASLTRVMQRFDMAGTYAAIAAVIIVGCLRMNEFFLKKKSSEISRRNVYGWLLLMLTLDVIFYVFKWQMNSTFVLPFMIIVLMGIAVFLWSKKEVEVKVFWPILALFFVVLAYTFWVLDVKKILCDPDSLLQGHAAWHILTGLSLLFMYIYFRKIRFIYT